MRQQNAASANPAQGRRMKFVERSCKAGAGRRLPFFPAQELDRAHRRRILANLEERHSFADELVLRQRQLDGRQEVLAASTNDLHQVTKLAIARCEGCWLLEAGRTFFALSGSGSSLPSA